MEGSLRALILVAAGIAASVCCVSNAASAAKTRSGQINIKYIPPKSDALRPVFQYLKDSRALERVQQVLSGLRLPRRLLIKTEDCNGDSNAWYENDAVTICYELVDDIWKNAASETTLGGVAPIDTVVGPFLDVVLHEVGHAVFEILRVPVFGREEDAADQFSAYLVLQAEKSLARRLILGNAYQYRADLKPDGPAPALKAFADVHGTPVQRFYNVLCIAYGADPELFKDVVEKDYLPKDRAEGCVDEYRQADYAFARLIRPNLDPRLAAKHFRANLPAAQSRPKRRK